MKYLKIKDNMFLNILPIDVAPEQINEEVEAQNQFLIFDRSGSMCGYINSVLDAATEYCKSLPDGSTVSIGYFSGTGEYNLSVPYTLKKEIDGAVKVINSYRSTIGLTNFIEILNKVNSVAANNKGKSSLFFFTDGCHNSGGSRSEIIAILKKWTAFANVTTFVGYGYIDRDMLTKMAKATDGSFIHLSSFKEFNNTLYDFGNTVADSLPTIRVKVPKDCGSIAAIAGASIVEYTPDENDEISYRPINAKKFNGVFFLSDKPITGYSEITSSLTTKEERGVRALAYIYSQKNDAITALDLMAFLGDKAIIEGLYNSIAPDEFAETETVIRKSVFKPEYRFMKGEDKNYLPAPDALCVLDVINTLCDDEGVRMHVHDNAFEYEKIGSATEQTDGSKVLYKEEPAVYFNNIVYNKERLNVSVSTEVTGYVPLDPKQFNTGFTAADLEKLGIAPEYKVSLFRTYNIITDGRLNTKKIVISGMSQDTKKRLASVCEEREDGRVIVNLGALPLLNKLYVKSTSGKELAVDVWNEKLLTDKIACYTAIKKFLQPEGTPVGSGELSKAEEERQEFLAEKCYIKKGAYNPPVKVVRGNDCYEAYAFSIAPKGYSKASASEVLKKIRTGSKTTARESIILDAYKALEKVGFFKKSEEAQIKELDAMIKSEKIALNKVRSSVQARKLAIVLGNKGKMDEFSSRENMQLTISGNRIVATDSPEDVLMEFTIEKTTVNI